jgi:glycosyltransferase involved in cell wall biosynthesis
LVTVVTVVYNAESVIAETIESVLSQDYPAVEYVIVDGASTDESWNVIQEYEEAVDRAISESDDGIYDAMNKGAELATGEWVIYMNAGDQFASNDALSSVRQELAGDADVLLAGVEEVLEDECETRRFRRMPESEDNLWRRMPTSHQSVLVRREHLLDYPFDTSYEWCADQDQLLRLWEDGKSFESVDVILSVFDCHDTPDRPGTLYIRERWRLSRGSAPLYRRCLQFGKEWAHATLWGPVVSIVRRGLPEAVLLWLRRIRGTQGSMRQT